MKAAVLYEARQPLQIEEMEMPAIGDGDVLIRVAACGVCHTDASYSTAAFIKTS